MIEASHLELALDGKRILDRVSFSVASAESVALVGPNGSGKTSVLRCLLGLVPFEGEATIAGYDVVREPIAARAQVGYVPQKAAFGDVCAREALGFVARLRALSRDGIDRALGEVGLAAHASQPVRTFSVGMQQRLAIAVALLGDPAVLLLDEPSASLDEGGQRAFYGLIGRLRASGHTLLLASHRSEEVAALTDRVIRLEGGRIIDTVERDDRSRRVARIDARAERR